MDHDQINMKDRLTLDCRLKLMTIIVVILSTINISFSKENQTDSLYIKLKKAQNYKDSIRIYLDENEKHLFTDPENAIEFCNKAYNIATKHHSFREIGITLSKKGSAFLFAFQTDSAWYCLNKALFILKKYKDAEIVQLYNSIGNYYKLKNDHVSALEYYLKARDLAKEKNNLYILTSSLINITQVYLHYNKMEEAYNCLSQAIVVAKKTGNRKHINFCFQNLGNYYLNKKDFKKALVQYNHSLSLYNDKNYDYLYSFTLLGIGMAYEGLNKRDEGIFYYHCSLDFANSINDLTGISNSLIQIANFYLNDKNYTKAIEYGNKFIKLFNENSLFPKTGIAEILSVAYEKKGNYEESSKYYKLFISENEFLNKNEIQNLNSLVFDYEIKSKEKEYEIGKLKMENEIIKNKENNRFWLSVTIISLLLFLLLFFMLGYINKRQKLKLNRAKLEQAEIYARLIEENKEKEIKNKEMEKLAIYINEKNRSMEEFTEMISRYKKKHQKNEIKDQEISDILEFCSKNFRLTDERKEFGIYIDNIHQDFLTKLTLKYPQLNDYDKRIATLIKLNYSTKEIASILNISVRGVETQRYKLRKKMDVNEKMELGDFLCTI